MSQPFALHDGYEASAILRMVGWPGKTWPDHVSVRIFCLVSREVEDPKYLERMVHQHKLKRLRGDLK
jgi:hypothetical protein